CGSGVAPCRADTALYSICFCLRLKPFEKSLVLRPAGWVKLYLATKLRRRSMFDYLQPGIVVKDGAGIRKTITRIEDDKVYWVYADRSERRQHSANYADLVDQRRATLHQSIPNPVQGLHIELLLGLDRYEAHVLFAHGFGDRFAIEEVVLVGLTLGLDELARNESHFVPL